MIGSIDHIGFAVRDLAATLRLYRDVLGLPVVHEEIDPYGGLKAAFVKVGDTYLEFLQDVAPEAAGGTKVIDQRDIARAIEKRGEGLHHIAFRVPDIRAAMREMAARGLRLIDAQPRPGCRDSQIFFLHPQGTNGVLIHFVERPGD
jgi:methylmalonyl-CoA epimerase